MNDYRIAVCDDDGFTQKEICSLCDEILTKAKIKHEITAFSTAEELEAALAVSPNAFHLLILDIMMDKGKSGMELAKEIRSWKNRVSILFLTGYDCFWKEGYGVQPIQYLLKPIKKEELAETLLHDWEMNHRPYTVEFQKRGRSFHIQLSSILYVASSGKHRVQFFLKDRVEEFYMSMAEAEALLPSQRFVRCHTSYLVNMWKVLASPVYIWIMV